MPSGVTHDRITLMSLPLVGGCALLISQSTSITLSLTGSFLFSGLMFGPDLDIHSVQFNRWGPLRWIWRPYQKVLQHRSWLSHGPIVGTLGRLLYVGCWISLFGVLFTHLAIAQHWSIWSWPDLADSVRQHILQYRWEWGGALVGLELGAMSHSFSDRIGSAWKKWTTGGRSRRHH